MNEEMFSSCLVIGAGGQTGQLFLASIVGAKIKGLKIEAVEKQKAKEYIKKYPSVTISSDLSESLKRKFDVIIAAVPVNAEDVFEILADKVKKNTILILPQNGTAVADLVQKLFKGKEIIPVRASLFTTVSLNEKREAVYDEKKLRIALAHLENVGAKSPLPPFIKGGALMLVRDLFEKSGFAVKLFKDYKSMEWTKLLVNSIGSTASITGMTPGETFNDSELFRLEMEGIKARLTIMSEAGIEFAKIPWQKISLIPVLIYTPKSVLSNFQQIIRDLIIRGRNRNEPPAGARKIAEGVQTEIRYYHQPFIELGRQHGLRSYADEAIYEIITEHEKGLINLAKLGKEERKKLLLDSYKRQKERPLISRVPLMTSIVNGLVDIFVKKIDMYGAENLKVVRESLKRGKSIVIIANHLSHADHAVLVKALGSNGFKDIADKFIFVAGMLFENEFIAKHLSEGYTKIIISTPPAGAVSEEENRKAQIVNLRGFREANRLLAQGNIMVVYAEGTRSRKKVLQKAIASVALYFENQNVEYVVPVGITGTADILPVGRTIPQFGSAIVSIGTPLTPANLLKEALKNIHGYDKETYRRDKIIKNKVYQKAVDFVMVKIAKMLPEEQRGYYK